MDKSPLPLFFFFSSLILLFTPRKTCTAQDNTTVTPTQYIIAPQTVTSSGEIFKLGFFRLGSSSNRYVGIWYNKLPGQPIVWIANRDNPIKDSSGGVLKIADDGNLVALDGRGIVYWTTNVSNIVSNNSTAELLDSGNLVLRQVNDSKIVWQSFDFPTDTILPGMRIGINRRTGKTQQLTSWKSESDPSTGFFSMGIDNLTGINIPQVVVWSGSQRLWRSGPWKKKNFIGVDSMEYLDEKFLITRDPTNDSVYGSFNYRDNSSFIRYVLDHRGERFREIWDGGNEWTRKSTNSFDECEFYSYCGPYGKCEHRPNLPVCSCLEGFTPKSEFEWSRKNWSGGCMRKMELQCKRNMINTSRNEGAEKADKFLKLKKMKVPDFANWLAGVKNFNDCQNECVKNCSCLAFSYDTSIGCMTWVGSLVDIRWITSGIDLHIRVANTKPGHEKNSKVIIITAVIIGALVITVCTYFSWRWRAKHRVKRKKDQEIPANMYNVYKESSDPKMLTDNTDLKIFKYEKLAIATNNFCGANKLGQGGFGPVYRGNFTDDGQVIAVKRLSKCSLQGFEEFKNEVLVILKLQHRNLVRLLGCCIEGDEKMLIYEYMPNKSLDAFIFDPIKQELLDWRKRFHIIEGISRGILYLHEDSRLRVIHRDLKASNILLDEELNPKISDFGLARMFGGNELQANYTRRVVGTYGYMSPEYAMEGLFSEKSDVFSFGVLLLEIVSGKKNTGFYDHELSSSLLGHAWQLWNNENIKLLIDRTLLSEPDFEVEILRCIHVGLLCVQEFAKDRPTMSITLSMLTGEIGNLPSPKQPAFTERRVSPHSNPSQMNQAACSVNNLSLTDVEGR